MNLTEQQIRDADRQMRTPAVGIARRLEYIIQQAMLGGGVDRGQLQKTVGDMISAAKEDG